MFHLQDSFFLYSDIINPDKVSMVPRTIHGVIFSCRIITAAPYELPAGIIMAFIGGPFFMYLLLKKKGGRRINA